MGMRSVALPCASGGSGTATREPYQGQDGQRRPGRRNLGLVLAGALSMVLSQGALGADSASSEREAFDRSSSAGEAVTPSEFNGNLAKLPALAPYGGPRIDIDHRKRKKGARKGGYRPWKGTLPAVPKVDPLLKAARERRAGGGSAGMAGSFDTPKRNFQGQSNDEVSNPDTVGDIGRRYYIQMVNAAGGSTFKIFTKKGKTKVKSLLLGTLAEPDSRCRTGAGDPIVLYDQAAKRWLMSEIAAPVEGEANVLCVYISKKRNPVKGGWWAYQFETPGFPDYPHYGAWPDAYYVGVNEAGSADGEIAAAYAMDRANMLRGMPATMQRFGTEQLPGFSGFNELTPADVDGKKAPPAGAPAYFVRHVDDEFHFNKNTSKDYLEIYTLALDLDDPGNSKFKRLQRLKIADFDSTICDDGAAQCIPQPNTGQGLDSLPEMTLWRVQYRNMSGVETLVGTFTVDANGEDHAGIRWFVLTKEAGKSKWSLAQQGTHAPDSASRWMGSIAMDGCGNLALGYSVSSDSIFPGIRYAGRLASDPEGTLPQGEHSIQEGEGSQGDGNNRWGDYTSMNVDPKNDRTFWYTNQFADEDGLWRTRIASFQFPKCKG